MTMLTVAADMYSLSMCAIYAAGAGARTSLGQIVAAGERINEPPRVPAPFRTMEDWVLTYVVEGSGTYHHIDGQRTPIRSGAVILVPPSVPHWYGAPPGGRWTETFAVFTGPLFDLLLATRGLPDGPRFVEPRPPLHELHAVVRATESTPGNAEQRLLNLADWLLYILRPTGPDHPSTPIERAGRRLAADTAATLDMHDVAADVGLSYTTFRRRFTSEMGTSPAAYRNTARMAAVASLLKLTDMTNREIARQFRFTDEFHLSRRFKAYFGVPPSTYRRLHRHTAGSRRA
jgi:AraC-like DNA-binding protein